MAERGHINIFIPVKSGCLFLRLFSDVFDVIA